jgi:hypothetical protein
MRFRKVISTLILLPWTMLGCETLQPRSRHHPGNAVDILYRLQTNWVLPSPKPAQPTGVVSDYRSLGAIMFSECRNFPSDSTFLTLMQQQKTCDTFWSLPQAVSRLLREGDIARIPGYQPIPHQGRLTWVDFPAVCR